MINDMKRIIFIVIAAVIILIASCSSNKDIGVGSSLEDLLELYQNYKIEIYYNEMGSYDYTSVETMLDEYGDYWLSAFNDWAIFTPLNQDGEEAEIRFFLKFKSLDDRNKYKKDTKIWLVQD